MTARLRFAPAALLLLATAASVHADDPQPKLGPAVGEMTDVTFKPFADAKKSDRRQAGEIAYFEQEQKHWTLSFARAELKSSQSLKDGLDDHGNITAGFLTSAANQLRSTGGGADVLRNEVIYMGDLPVGVLMAQVTEKGQPILLQEAFIQISEKLYYSLAMTSPCPAKDIGSDPAVVDAGLTFRAILDSVQRNDLRSIRDDQDDRLIRTRALFVNWNRKHILAALRPEQFFIFKRDGKPVGYAYIVQQPANGIKTGETEKEAATVTPETATGFRVGQRTRMMIDGKTVDGEAWMYADFDRRHEVWSTVTVVNDSAAKSEKEKMNWFSEVGATDMQRERVFDQGMRPDDLKNMDDQHRKGLDAPAPFHEVDKYRLTARPESRSSVADPIQRDLPPFYIPQAIGAILPQLVPLNNPTGYMFATYNSENRVVMARYVDVKPEATVKINGRETRAVAVADRAGLQGEPTTHYLTAAGGFLGSVNGGANIEIDPSDRATLIATFQDANLTQPGAVKAP